MAFYWSLSSPLVLVFFLGFIHFWPCTAAAANCSRYSGMSCKECVEQSGCFYCKPTKLCEAGDLVKSTLQKSCEGQEWMTEQCLVTGKILLIALPVAGFVLLVTIGCCIYCCCCRKTRARGGTDKDEVKSHRKRKKIADKHKEREKERQEKRDEIRKKYGIESVWRWNKVTNSEASLTIVFVNEGFAMTTYFKMSLKCH